MNESKCVVLRFRRNTSQIVTNKIYTINGSPLIEKEAHRDLGVLVDTSLKFHDHIRETVFKANGTSINLLKSTVCRSPAFMTTLFVTHIRPILDFCSTVWNTGYIGDMKMLEQVQRRWTKRIDGLTNEPYGNRLRSLGIFSVQGRLLRSDLIMCWKIFHNKSSIDPSDIFESPPQGTRTRGHNFKLFKLRCSTDVRKRFFSERIFERWNNLSMDTVSSSTLTEFKSKLACEIEEHLYEYAD